GRVPAAGAPGASGAAAGPGAGPAATGGQQLSDPDGRPVSRRTLSATDAVTRAEGTITAVTTAAGVHDRLERRYTRDRDYGPCVSEDDFWSGKRYAPAAEHMVRVGRAYQVDGLTVDQQLKLVDLLRDRWTMPGWTITSQGQPAPREQVIRLTDAAHELDGVV